MSESFDVAANATFVAEADDPIIPNPAEFVNDEAAQEEARSFALSFGRNSDKSSGRKTRAKKEKTPKPTPPKPRAGALKKPLMEMYGSIGMAVSMFDPQCGFAVMQNAEKCAEAMEGLARENEAVRRVVMNMIQTSVWGQVLAAHSPIIFAIAAHHVPKIANSPIGQMQAATFQAMQEKSRQADAEEMQYYQDMENAA